jgi:hypothetical protein
VQGISEFEDGEHFPQPWIAEEEAQGATLGLVNTGISLGLFPSFSFVPVGGDALDSDGLGLAFCCSSLGNP